MDGISISGKCPAVFVLRKNGFNQLNIMQYSIVVTFVRHDNISDSWNLTIAILD